MIQRLLAIATVASAALLMTPKAEAGHSCDTGYVYRSGYSSCGCPIYTKRYVRGYDCYRRPIYGYIRLDLRHGSSCRHHHAHRNHPVYQPPVYRRVIPSHGSRISIHGGGVHVDIGRRGYPYPSRSRCR